MADWSGRSNNGSRTTDHGQPLTRARAAFTARFGGEPAVAGCAPGRVELLGNHTDYNGGLVMAAAIDRFDGRRRPSFEPVERRRSTRSTSAQADALLARRDRTHRGRDLDPICPRRLLGPDRMARAARVGLRGVDRRRCPARGRTLQLGEPPGVRRLVPDPARPASRSIQPTTSAADHDDLLRMELAKALRRSENEFVGVGSGLLDQFSSLFGRADHALFLDCDTLSTTASPGQARPGDRGVRLEDLAPAGRRHVRPAGGPSATASRPSSATRSPIAANSSSRG